MDNFTYIFGAGASANALPLVKELGGKLGDFLKDIGAIAKLNETEEDRKLNDQVKKDLKWLVNEESKHASIDTFAKKLYLTGQFNCLKILKALIDSFFIYQQVGTGTDKRYDAFLASLFTGTNSSNISLPANITVLSWNYDLQLELSLANFFMTVDISDLESRCKFIPNNQNDLAIKKEFSIIKLNGSAGGLSQNEKAYKRKDFSFLFFHQTPINSEFDEESSNRRIDVYRNIIKNYNGTIKDENYVSSILFAWEKNQLINDIRMYCKLKTNTTTILTVIGYSFPTFNREIDKEILANMPHLKKIIIQAPIESADSIVFRVVSLLSPERKINFEKITSIDEFFIPFEFN